MILQLRSWLFTCQIMQKNFQKAEQGVPIMVMAWRLALSVTAMAFAKYVMAWEAIDEALGTRACARSG